MPYMTTTRYGGINPWVFATLADMRALPADQAPGPGPALAVLTGTVAFDGSPAGLYAWDAASVLADNGSGIIKLTAVTTGRFIRVAS